MCTSFNLGDGKRIRFCEDSWIQPSPLASLFVELYERVVKRNAAVASQWSYRNQAWSVRCRGPFSLAENIQYEALVQLLQPISPSRSADQPIWKLSSNGSFSVYSFYKFLNCGGLLWPFHEVIWRTTAPEKVKIFLWLALKNRLHTGDVLQKKDWGRGFRCLFCGTSQETISHLLIRCPFAKSLWFAIKTQLHIDGWLKNITDL